MAAFDTTCASKRGNVGDSAFGRPNDCVDVNSSSTLRTRLAASHSAGGITTGTIGRSNAFANSKSRSSCAGTAMIAPVPYDAST